MVRRILLFLLVTLLMGSSRTESLAAGKYCLAFWREVGFNEKGGIGGNHVINVHLWDENGNPLSGKHVYTGTLDMGTTDSNGQVELAIYEPNAYPLRIVDGGNLTDETPGFSSTRAPDWGHYSFECGFVYVSDSSNPPTFDLAYDGIFNSSSAAYACNNIEMSAPRTRSLAFCSTKPDPGYYCSDQYETGGTVTSVGQTFKANGNRVVACKFHSIGSNTQYTVRIREGGPTGPYIGSSATSPPVGTYEYSKTLTKWGLNAVQVIPGNTYFVEITKLGGGTFAVNRVINDNYSYGSYYEGTTPFSLRELRGEVVCATVGPAPGTGTISGYVRDTSNNPVSGAAVSTSTGGYNATSDGSGYYTLSNVTEGTYSVTASKTGFDPQTKSNIIVTAGQTTTCDFNLAPNTGAIAGYIRDAGGTGITGATVSTNTGGYTTTSGVGGSYTLSGVAPGTYNVTASKTGYGSQTNTGVVVTIGQTTTSDFTLSCIVPSITAHPQSQGRTVGQSATFSVSASGTPPLTYQWRKNGANISGASTLSYTIHTVTAGDAGSYDCAITNPCGSAISNAAALNVNTGASGIWDADKIWTAFDKPTKLSGTKWALESGSYTTENWGTSYKLGTNVYDRNGQTTALVGDNNGNTANSDKIKYRTDGEGWTVDSSKTTAIKLGFYAIDSSGAYPSIYIRTATKGVQIRYDDGLQAWVPGSDAALNASSPASLPVPLQTWHYIRFQMDPAGNWQAWLNEDPSQRMWGTAVGGGGGPYVQFGCLGSTTSNVEFAVDFVAWGQDSGIPPFGSGAISGVVKNTSNNPIDGATVSTTGGGYTSTTASNGSYTLSDAACGIYDVVASKSGYVSQTQTGKVVNQGQTTAVHFNLALADTTAPTTPMVTDDGAYTTSASSLHASWSATDPESGIAEYQYAIGTSPGASNVVGWTSVGTAASVTKPGLSLSYGGTYYFTVKARNGAGLWSSEGSSDGIRVARSIAGVAEVKSYPDGECVCVTGKVVSARFGDGFYIQESSRSGGIKVTGSTAAEGSVVTVIGILATANGERVITEASVQQQP